MKSLPPHHIHPRDADDGRGVRHAFTLLEVLVVVAIIALLCAILLPALAAARRSASQVCCQSNLRQIGVGWEMYLRESRGLFPQTIATRDNMCINFGGKQGSAGAPFTGPKLLNRYVGAGKKASSVQLFRCPLDAGGEVLPTFYDYYGSSYQMSDSLVGINDLPYPTSNPYGDLFKRMKDDHVTRVRVGFFWVTRVHVSQNELADPPARVLYAGDYGWRRRIDPLLDDTQNVDWHDPRDAYNLLFGDSHVSLTRVIRGKYRTADYLAIPFRNLQKDLDGR